MIPAINAILILWNSLSPKTRKAVVDAVASAPEVVEGILRGDPVDLTKLPPLPTADELEAEVEARRASHVSVGNA